jgi:hypothetical protein
MISDAQLREISFRARVPGPGVMKGYGSWRGFGVREAIVDETQKRDALAKA